MCTKEKHFSSTFLMSLKNNRKKVSPVAISHLCQIIITFVIQGNLVGGREIKINEATLNLSLNLKTTHIPP